MSTAYTKQVAPGRALAQTWHARIRFRATDTSVFTKQDHMPVSSRALAQTRLPYGGQAWHARVDFIAPVHAVLNGQ
jgi:hypothetical protein